MARKRKANIDYFPHDCIPGKTIYILECRFGNDGYATWYKILQQLGNADGHYLDLRDQATLLYVAALCLVDEKKLIDIIDTLASLDAIDCDLWRGKVVFSGGLVKRVTDAYRKRINDLPTKEKVISALNLTLGANPPRIEPKTDQSGAEMTQRERERERERTTATTTNVAETFERKRNWLSAKFPNADLDFQKEKLLTKYPDNVADPWLLILNWFELVGKGGRDGRSGTSDSAKGARTEKGGASCGAVDATEKPPGYFAGDFPDRSDEW